MTNVHLFDILQERSCSPALAIPIQTKQVFECPLTHLQHLKERLPHVDKLLIVGWRGMDQHFVSLLRDGLKQVRGTLVCGDAADSASLVATLQKANIEGEFQTYDHGFTRYVVERHVDGYVPSGRLLNTARPHGGNLRATLSSCFVQLVQKT